MCYQCDTPGRRAKKAQKEREKEEGSDRGSEFNAADKVAFKKEER
jgi:hypothetical protein